MKLNSILLFLIISITSVAWPSYADDFNGDGMSDIFWRSSTGINRIWTMNGTTRLGVFTVPALPAVWSLVATGDINGDGKTDLIWRHTKSGRNMVWLMNKGTVIVRKTLQRFPLTWSVAGSADYNGDGKDDILWRSNNGQNQIWFMNGATILKRGKVTAFHRAWKIAGTGDFNGDGRADILWRNSKNGRNNIWSMNGTRKIAGVSGAIPRTAKAWSVLGTGDFNRDGMDDILWRSPTGRVQIWNLNGASRVSVVKLKANAKAFHVANVADFNGDGNVDILWRNIKNGGNQIWTLNNGKIVVNGKIPKMPLTWSVSTQKPGAGNPAGGRILLTNKFKSFAGGKVKCRLKSQYFGFNRFAMNAASGNFYGDTFECKAKNLTVLKSVNFTALNGTAKVFRTASLKGLGITYTGTGSMLMPATVSLGPGYGPAAVRKIYPWKARLVLSPPLVPVTRTYVIDWGQYGYEEFTILKGKGFKVSNKRAHFSYGGKTLTAKQRKAIMANPKTGAPAPAPTVKRSMTLTCLAFAPVSSVTATMCGKTFDVATGPYPVCGGVRGVNTGNSTIPGGQISWGGAGTSIAAGTYPVSVAFIGGAAITASSANCSLDGLTSNKPFSFPSSGTMYPNGPLSGVLTLP